MALSNPKIGYEAVVDALVTLIGTTHIANLNSGLAKNVATVAKGDPLVRPLAASQYPAVIIDYAGKTAEEQQTAGNRRIVTLHLDIYVLVRMTSSATNDCYEEVRLICDNAESILREHSSLGDTVLASDIPSTNFGYVRFGEGLGVFSAGVIRLDVRKLLS